MSEQASEVARLRAENKKLEERLKAKEGGGDRAFEDVLRALGKGEIDGGLKECIGELLKEEQAIRDGVKASKEMTEAERADLKRQVTSWEHNTQQLMYRIFAKNSLSGKRRKHSALRRILTVGISIACVAAGVAFLVRLMFYHTNPPMTVRAI